MSKKRKLHELKGIIQGCWPGQVTGKSQWKGRSFYFLEITTQNLFTGQSKQVLYAFPNLVSKEIWNILEQQTYLNKNYLFFCEKRTRGWRLKTWTEIK